MNGGIVGSVANGATVTEATAIGFYLVYAGIAVGLVVFLARTLSRNGQIFLEEAFRREDLASSVNQLLVIGFYLLNLGYALLVYRVQSSYPSVIEAFNDLMTNVGVLLLSLGALHLVNMVVLWRIGRGVLRAGASGAYESMPPPPPPSPWVADGGWESTVGRAGDGSGRFLGADGADRLG